jgi:hypothetical protein
MPQPEDESERGSGNECGAQEPGGSGDRFECQNNYCGYHKQTSGMFGDYADAVTSKRFTESISFPIIGNYTTS